MSGENEVVRSAKNARIQELRSVLAGRVPGRIALEGERLIADAVRAGVRLETLFLAEGLETPLADAAQHVIRATVAVLQGVSRLETSPGLIALADTPATRPIEDLLRGARSLVCVVCGVSDPGNLGGIARSAEAAGASGLVVLAGGARPFTDKALRGSMGSLLRLPVAYAASAPEVAAALARSGVRSFVLETRGGSGLEALAVPGPLALWIGAETGELPAECAAFEALTIPMAGAVESLNVTVAASLALFACARVGGGEP